jgi:hypothetical protein
MIDVEVNGARYQEMHVDGGTERQVFAYPPSVNFEEEAAASGATRERRIYVIRNARLDPDWSIVRRRTIPIAGRAVSELMRTQGVGDLYELYTATQRDRIDYNLAFIPSDFNAPHKEQFDTHYMRELYNFARNSAIAGYPWKKYPPGFTQPLRSAVADEAAH